MIMTCQLSMDIQLQDIIFQGQDITENHHKTAVIFDDDEDDDDNDDDSFSNRRFSLTYFDLLERAKELKTIFSSFFKPDQIVGISLMPSCDVPSILISILSSRCAFYPLSSDGLGYSISGIKKVKASWLLVHSSFEQEFLTAFQNFQTQSEFISNNILLKYQLKLMKLSPEPESAAHTSTDFGPLAYCITTSGTTSSPKVVQVPHSCIVPNVLSIRSLFDVKCTDKLLLSSPLTFDPSMIDIFVSLSCGATLVIVPDKVKRNPAKLLNVIHNRQAITVLQATPTLISRFSPNHLKRSILGPNSSLRLLALGGEKFPTGGEMKKWMHPANKTQLFNLYGITEVSCWAACEKVNAKQLLDHNAPVSIGKALDKTLIKVSTDLSSSSKEGNIMIGSAERICFVLMGSDDATLNGASPDQHTNKTRQVKHRRGKVVWRDTGDQGRIMPDGSIIFLGRSDNQIKRNGKRLNISALEEACLQLQFVSDCHVLLSRSNHLVGFIIIVAGSEPQQHSLNESSQPQQRTSNDTVKDEEFMSPHDTANVSSVSMKTAETKDPNDTSNTDFHISLTLRRKKSTVSSNFESRWEKLKGCLIDHLKVVLPSHYMPDLFVEIDQAFPVTPHGKLDKKALLNMIRMIPMDSSSLFTSTYSWACKLWQLHLPVSASQYMIKSEDNFLSLGGDSLSALGLVNTLERAIKVSATVFLDMLFNKSFGYFVEHLRACLSSEPSKTISEESLNTCKAADVLIIDAAHENEGIRHSLFNLKDESSSLDSENGNSNSQGNGNEFVRKSQNSYTTEKLEDFKLNLRKKRQSSLTDSSHGIYKVICKGNRVSYFENDIVEENLLHEPASLSCNEEDENLVRSLLSSERNLSMDNNAKNKDVEKDNSLASEEKPMYYLKPVWKFNTEKCVDASPTIIDFRDKVLVFTGSHSGIFSAIDLNSGKIVWRTTLPDRIESSACCSKNLQSVIVGCYDGGIYFLSTLSGSVEWCFKTKDIVKCSPSLDMNRGHVICGSHDGNVYCLNNQNETCIWQRSLDGGGILASPLIHHQSDSVYVASLRGKVFALKCNDGQSVWCVDLKKPIFSSPCFDNHSIVVGCTDNSLYCFNHTGVIEWKFNASGPIFSSPVSQESTIFFGCHDHNIYCISSKGHLKWRVNGHSTVFSTPFVFQCVNNGKKSAGETETPYKFPAPHISLNRNPSSKPHLPAKAVSGISIVTNAKRTVDMTGHADDNEGNASISRVNDDLIPSEEPQKKKTKRLGSHEFPTFHDDKSLKGNVDSTDDSVAMFYHKPDKETKVKAKKYLNSQVMTKRSNCDIVEAEEFDCNHERNVFNESVECAFVTTAASKGVLYVIKTESGNVVCEQILPGEIFSSPVVCNNKVVIGCRDNFIYCYEFVT